MNVAALEGVIKDRRVPDSEVLKKIIEFRQSTRQQSGVTELPLDLSNTTWQYRPAILSMVLHSIMERQQKCCMLTQA